MIYFAPIDASPVNLSLARALLITGLVVEGRHVCFFLGCGKHRVTT